MPYSFRQLTTHGKNRIKRRHRFLKDHTNFVATNRWHQIGIRFCQINTTLILAIKDHLAACNFAAAELDQSHQRKAGDRFSRAGFANNTNSFTRTNVERHVLNTNNRARLGLELDTQISDGRNRVIQHG